MSSLDFTAVCVVCATAIVVAWIAFDRWYMHRGRVEQQMAAMVKATCEATREMAREQITHVREEAERALHEELEQLIKLRNDVQKHEQWIQSASLSSRRS